jgi:hypothetical protein
MPHHCGTGGHDSRFWVGLVLSLSRGGAGGWVATSCACLDRGAIELGPDLLGHGLSCCGQVPFFSRGWQSPDAIAVSTGSPDRPGARRGLALLLGGGTVARRYSPWLIPHGKLRRRSNFEAASRHHRSLVLLGQVLELRAASIPRGRSRPAFNLAPKTARRMKGGRRRGGKHFEDESSWETACECAPGEKKCRRW